MLPWKLAIVIHFTFLIIYYCNSAESTATNWQKYIFRALGHQ